MLINYTTEQANTIANPPSRAPMVLGVNTALLSIAVLFVTLRLIVKGKLGKLAIEDALIVISTLITISLIIITAVATRYGLGLHVESVRPEWWPMYSKFSFASTVLGSVCYPVTKLSMLIFYLRLAPDPIYRKVCFCTIGYIAFSSATATFVNLFHCTPVRGAWDHDSVLNAKCLDPQMFFYVYSSLNVITDVLLVIIPIPIIMKLQLQYKIKLGLVFMFAAGILMTAISAYGVHAMYAAYHSADFTWDGVFSWMWALAEFSSGIIVACMPSMLMFVRWVRGDMNDSKQSHNSGTATIGSGGGNVRSAGKIPTSEIKTRISRGHGSEEYIMREVDGIVKSTELVIVETGWDRNGNMC